MNAHSLTLQKCTADVRPEVRLEPHPRAPSSACPRCGGLIVPEAFMDMKASCTPTWILGGRCANCGFLGDSLVSRHRAMTPTNATYPQPRRRRGFRRLDPIRKEPIRPMEQDDDAETSAGESAKAVG